MADSDTKIVPVEGALVVEEMEPKRAEMLDNEAELEVGQWYWVQQSDDKKPWLGCIVHVGSNYVQLEGVQYTTRVHFDAFDKCCTPEPDPDTYIDSRIKHYQDKVNRLMGRVKELTARLGVAPSPELTAGSETKALALVNSNTNMDEYKTALVKAKEDQLPDLFDKIGRANKAMANWMTAKIIPLKAQAEGMRGTISTIEDRIFSVELYAGLTEQVAQIAEGEPAALGTKVHLLQRRCYMDEECLAEYQAGGMDFEGIGAFDCWLREKANRDRLLPFERCIVAFRVRRDAKERELVDLSDFIRFIEMAEADKRTFLYIRNGEQIFRMSTAIDFGPKLFPDPDRSKLASGQKLWAKSFAGSIREDEGLITDDEYQAIMGEYRKEVEDYEAWKKTVPKKDWWQRRPSEPFYKYVPFTPSSVYYDDIANMVEDQLKQHNRIALIIQGLLDRSPVLHPHPPWQIWTQEGFAAALELVFDDSRALVAGEKPDFEAYRARLNASLKTGSVTVGQEDAWERYEGAKECDRMDRDYRTRGSWRPSRHRPYGNPGPGTVAQVFKYTRSGKATFAWNRERQDWRSDKDKDIRTTFTCSSSVLLNVDAYTPGDFKLFFNDPRTRAEYLKWAPLLLEAEEYHAGNREVQEPVEPQQKESSYEGRIRYQQRKRRKALMGCAVRLTEPIETKGGSKYEVGSLWRVMGGSGGTFWIGGIRKDGSRDDRWVTGVSHHDFVVEPAIPKIKIEG